MPKIRGSRDTRDWAPEFNTEEPKAQSAPWCPGCWEDAPWGTYPPSTRGVWWCSECLHLKVKEARGGVNE
jgi:hypothetical protein